MYVKFEATEPVFLSPFIFGSGHGQQGFYGNQAMKFQMVMNEGNAYRAGRCASLIGVQHKTTTVVSDEDSQLLFQFITPHTSDMLDPPNVVPYYEIPVYKRQGSNSFLGDQTTEKLITTGFMKIRNQRYCNHQASNYHVSQIRLSFVCARTLAVLRALAQTAI